MISLPKKVKKTLYVYLNKAPHTLPSNVLVFSFIDMSSIDTYLFLQTQEIEVEINESSQRQIANYINKEIFN